MKKENFVFCVVKSLRSWEWGFIRFWVGLRKDVIRVLRSVVGKKWKYVVDK